MEAQPVASREDAVKAWAAYCRSVGFLPHQLHGSQLPEHDGFVMDLEMAEDVFRCLRHRL